ncbi:MAG TPA: zf-HC2 domain-containing protein, partial [Armatimonadota bacterium]|nr:zf-HC2 domain-containing protein [Armatimonadota bacterium]
MAERCTDNEELLSRLVDNDLDGAGRRATAAHVLACEDCSRATGQMLATKRLLDRSDRAAEVPLGFADRLRRRLDAADPASRPRRAALIPPAATRVVAIAAVGLILISGAALLDSVMNPVTSSVDLLVA